jgi:hypothetical protein
MLRKLWLRWVLANAAAELVGLGGTLGLGAFIIFRLGLPDGVGGVLANFAVAVASGAIEATLVGWLQWRVLRRVLAGISLRAWWLGTLVGALLAYILGYLPSTLIDLAGQSALEPAPMAEPPQWVVLLLASGLGLVGGALLSFAQWLALRGKVKGAGIWVPANMAAWMLGMPLIFLGIDLAQKGQPLPETILIMALTLLSAGAVVGAVHGLALVRLAKQNGA